MTEIEQEQFSHIKEMSEVMHYDPFSGEFFWHEGKKPKRRRGDKWRVNMVNRPTGYKVFTLKNKREIAAHRLAWFKFYGKLPDGIVDHINGDKSDNRIANLRDVDYYENNTNRDIHRERGMAHTTVKRCKVAGKEYVYYGALVRQKIVGWFKTREEAYQCSMNYISEQERKG